MKKLSGSLAACLLVLGVQADTAAQESAAVPAPALSVAFVAPQDYTDAGYSRALAGERDRSRVMHGIEQHLQQLAARHLPPGYALSIDVLDIDLAGHFEPWRFRSNDVRVLRDSTGPRMRLRYQLTYGGQVLASAEEKLALPQSL
jgi:hypothetical protein